MDLIIRAKHSAKPLRQQIDRAERFVQKLEAAQTKRDQRAADLGKQLKDLQTQINKNKEEI